MTRTLWIALALAGCAATQGRQNPSTALQDAGEQSPAKTSSAASHGVTDSGLADLLEAHWEHLMRTSPLWATDLGDHRFDDQLGEWGPEANSKSREKRAELLAIAQGLQPSTASDQLTLTLFIQQLSSQTDREVCESDLWNISPRHNPLFLFNSLHQMHPIHSLADAENFLRRLDAVPKAIAQSIESLQAGIDMGLVANAESTRRVIEMADATLSMPSEDWPIASAAAPAGFELRTPVVQRIDETLRTSLSQYRDFLQEAILPIARGENAETLAALSNGQACYTALIKHHTTLSRSPEEIHKVGLDSLEQIHEEMKALGAGLFETEDLPAIFEALRTAPEMRFSTSEEVLKKASDALAHAKSQMATAFDPVPQAECEVKAIPDYEAPYTTIAYYRPSAADGSRPGTYFVNTHAPETRPRFEAEVLAYHEAIPGHHLQIAIAHELEDVPTFRRVMHMTAFVEGWALYSERLSDEMGLYTGPADRMGMLSFDSWRAARLVVDTGLHAQGWTRQQAIDFMLANTPLAKNNIENEVDRYITTPGQALAYKTGQLEILRLREHAEASLGDAFDLKGFHRAVLGGGAVSLGILAERIEQWIQAQQVE